MLEIEITTETLMFWAVCLLRYVFFVFVEIFFSSLAENPLPLAIILASSFVLTFTSFGFKPAFNN
jgi:hypothetical protein